MAIFSIHHPLQFTFGLLGNIVSFMVYLAPVPTFYRVYKNKSTEGFQAIPYVTALFSSMLWMYYAFLKSDAYLLVTVNSFGCVLETIYISMFIAYAPRKARILATRLVIFLNLVAFCFIVILSFLLANGPKRIHLLGWICVAVSASVFAAPLSIMKRVIETKSVEFMPFWLSFFLTLSAILWFGYGFLLKDIYVAIPNILGFIFGVVQIILYFIYKDSKKSVEEEKVAEQNFDVAKASIILNSEEHVVDLQPKRDEKCTDVRNYSVEEQTVTQQTCKNESIQEHSVVNLELPIPAVPMTCTNVICVEA